MSDEPEWFSWNYKPQPPKPPRPPDATLWTVVRQQDQVPFECGLRFEWESWGWDVRIFRGGDFLASHRFILRAQAELSAQEMKKLIFKGSGSRFARE